MTSPRRILIVEDEPLIAMMLEDFLDALDRELAGSADCVAGALDAIAAGGIDAAILDVNLRGGEKCWPIAARLAEAGVPFILATGGAGDMIEPDFRNRPVLTKPYTMNAVERTLDSLNGEAV